MKHTAPAPEAPAHTAPVPRAPARAWGDVVAELPDLCTVIDATGSVVVASPGTREQLGRDPADLMGRPACDLIPPQDRRNCTTWLRSVLAGHEPPELVHGLIRADGVVVPYETRLRLMSRPDHRLVVAVSRDVIGRTEFDRHLIEMSRLWNAVCETVHEGVLVLTDAGLVVAVNGSAARLLGGTPADLTGQAVEDLLATPDSRAGVPGAEPGPLDATTLRERGDRDLVVSVVCSGTAPDRVLRARASVLRDSDRDEAGEHIIVVLEPLPATHPAAARPFAHGRAIRPPHALSRREIEVLTLLVDGRDVQTISRDLHLSVHTTRAYVRSVLKKLDARTQLQAAIIALRTGLIDLS